MATDAELIEAGKRVAREWGGPNQRAALDAMRLMMADPKPAPPIGCMRDEHIDALKRDGRFVLNGETILYEAKPRDEAREAFDLLYRDWVFTTEYHKKDIYNAFLAGRASVKS